MNGAQQVVASEPAALRVERLNVDFRTKAGLARSVEDVSLSVAPGEVLGLVGESGSGKSATFNAVMGLLPKNQAVVSAASIRVGGRELTEMTPAQVGRLRGAEIAMIFQEPTRALNPAFTVGQQISEVVRRHSGASRREAWDRAVEILGTVRIPDPARRAKDYPHQFSGGMCQRVMLALAMVNEPKVLIADEPTTALDVTVQARMLDLMAELQDRTGVAIVLITHDLGVIARLCRNVAVMYAGHIVETAAVDDLFLRPRHPYTAALLQAIPRPGTESGRFDFIPGSVPPPGARPTGCVFHPRCAHAQAGLCTDAPIPLVDLGGRATRCVRARDVVLSGIDDA